MICVKRKSVFAVRIADVLLVAAPAHKMLIDFL